MATPYKNLARSQNLLPRALRRQPVLLISPIRTASLGKGIALVTALLVTATALISIANLGMMFSMQTMVHMVYL